MGFLGLSGLVLLGLVCLGFLGLNGLDVLGLPGFLVRFLHCHDKNLLIESEPPAG